MAILGYKSFILPWLRRWTKPILKQRRQWHLEEAYVVVGEYDGLELRAWFVDVDPVESGVVTTCPQPHRPVTTQTTTPTRHDSDHHTDPSRLRPH